MSYTINPVLTKCQHCKRDLSWYQIAQRIRFCSGECMMRHVAQKWWKGRP